MIELTRMSNIEFLNEDSLELINGGSMFGTVVGGVALVAGIVASAGIAVPVLGAIGIIGGIVSIADGIYDATH